MVVTEQGLGDPLFFNSTENVECHPFVLSINYRYERLYEYPSSWQRQMFDAWHHTCIPRANSIPETSEEVLSLKRPLDRITNGGSAGSSNFFIFDHPS